MARSFDIAAEYEHGVEDVLGAYAEEQYWLARLADSGVDVATIEFLRVEGASNGARTIDVVTLQSMYSQNLPAMITQMHPGDLCVRRGECWGPVTDGVATASIKGSIVDAPVNLSGTAVLEPIAGTAGSRLTFRISIQVRIPIIGGKVERMIGDSLGGMVADEQRFTTEWLARNA